MSLPAATSAAEFTVLSFAISTDPAEATHAYLWRPHSLSWSQGDSEGELPSILLRKDHYTRIDYERILVLRAQIGTTNLAADYTNQWTVNAIEPGVDAVNHPGRCTGRTERALRPYRTGRSYVQSCCQALPLSFLGPSAGVRSRGPRGCTRRRHR